MSTTPISLDLSHVVPEVQRSHAAPVGPLPRLHGPVLLAADGSALAGNAARVALAVAEHLGATMQVVSVVDSRGVAIPPPLDVAVALADDVIGPAVHDEQASDVRSKLAAELDTDIDWPVRVTLGAPSAEIARCATDKRAGLLVLGLRHHGALGRALQDQTAVHVMRRAPCPVLAVAPSLRSLPRQIVVGVDFGPSSEAAARVALDMLAPDGTLTLAYVSNVFVQASEDGERRIHALGVEAAFDALVNRLDAAPNVGIVRTIVAPPEPGRSAADQLLALCERTHADLIAIGTRRHGRVERWLLGSVATDVVRAGGVSVLTVPPQE